MGVKQCELCDRPARMHCESDQASLCWDCDAKVHGANFLVARHSRCLLCRSCQLPTPWKAEGAKLGPTVSVCQRCAAASAVEGEEGDRGVGSPVGGEMEVEGETGRRDMVEDDDDEDDDEEQEDEEDDGENQVVPWSLTPPPSVASSSSGETEESGRFGNGGAFLKRVRENADLAVSQEDRACSSSRPSYLESNPSPAPAPTAEDEATSFAPILHPSKDRKRAALLRTAVLDVPLMSHRPLPSSVLNRFKNPQA
ncbi:histone H3.v1-like [Canna indica]|uniref:Histone H3.v1-like n=1 Tax=Canna indica TaxID=4628 RepID=A0AAQ3K7A7_9LILI|nr:histone H3.v1-like [Canna indica]